jgi:NAD(P)-dependent dehydrogenase (short-subunit alcohol dehydrogenase family)
MSNGPPSPRVLIVGGSSGIGRSLAIRAAARGAQVVVSGRRMELLEEVATEAGACTPVVADVCVPEDCDRLASESVAAMGAVDLLVYAAGVSQLGRLPDIGQEDWAQVLNTNLLGAHQMIRSVLPSVAPGGVVALLSSDSSSAPRPGLVPYAASKAALEILAMGWRAEHPRTRFTCLAIGPTFPTDFSSRFDFDLMSELIPQWEAMGHDITAPTMTPDALADVLMSNLEAMLRNPSISLDYALVRPAAALP